ncbi:MAG: CRISPR-associated helicase Cas3' [Bacteroidota bacterium]
MKYIAHIKKNTSGIIEQTVTEHLKNVSLICKANANKIRFGKAGELIGLLHDFGKYSTKFQSYIKSTTGLINQDEDEYIDAMGLKGKIDHSTAGAQYIWNYSKDKKLQEQIVLQVLSLCVASHHSGLIDCLTVIGENNFVRRMNKPVYKTFFDEVLQKIDPEINEKVQAILNSHETIDSIIQFFKVLTSNKQSEKITRFQAGLMVRMLFSCLIDADRVDSSNFENSFKEKFRNKRNYETWDLLIERMEKHLRSFEDKLDKNKVDGLRTQISDACFNRAEDMTGLFTITVPTGGGKTLSSLRFALHHAKKHRLDRIIYVIPFISIIDQNAQVVRDILETEYGDEGNIVLEHHSNLIPELQNWKNKILTENWDAPIVFTTSVQLLETFFGSGTRGARRMHQLANAVIIFDEIQTLPIKTIHMFCNAVNYLTNHCHSTIVLCTATQPLLNNVSEDKGRIAFDKTNEIIPDVNSLFNDLKRVEVIDQTKQQGWSIDEIAELATKETNETGSCLIIVNTKKNAQSVYEACVKTADFPVYHLSTSMCPAHRMDILNEVKKILGTERLTCVSTQLIEAGVDVDFGSVIRFMAGLDSIAQAAGRCNRNGRRSMGRVHVVNPSEETIDSLYDIKIGKEVAERIFRELSIEKSELSNDLLHPAVMERYFKYYFFNRAADMAFPVDVGRDDNILNLLSTNEKSLSEYIRINAKLPETYFRHSFNAAAEAFKAIDAPNRGIVVPYGTEGEKIIADLFSPFAFEKQFALLRKAQRFTVNVFPNVLDDLHKAGAVNEVKDIEVLVLNDQYYHQNFGLSTTIVNEMKFLNP